MFSVTETAGPRTRSVVCYACGDPFEIPARALILTCPRCYQRVKVDDVVIYETHIGSALRTCGSILVARNGALHASAIHSSKAIEVLGKLQGHVTCAGPVFIGPKAVWEGDLTAGRIVIQPGATILGGHFRIASG